MSIKIALIFWIAGAFTWIFPLILGFVHTAIIACAGMTVVAMCLWLALLVLAWGDE